MLCVAFLLLSCVVVDATSSKCTGEHEYLDFEGKCHQCEMCPSGYEPTAYHCGYGKKSPLYTCKPCDVGAFSSTTDYNLCRICSPCTRWNTVISVGCTSTSDAVCGECYRGYYRPKKSDGNIDIECHKCNGSDNPDCRYVDWQLIVIILSIIIGILIMITIALVCMWKCTRSSTGSSKSSLLPRTKSDLDLVQIIACDRDSTTSLQPLPRSPLEDDSLIKNVGSPGLPSVTYSNQPTALFDQSALYPHFPTTEFRTNQFINDRRPTAGINPEIGNGLDSLTNRSDIDIYRRNLDCFETDSITKSLSAESQVAS